MATKKDQKIDEAPTMSSGDELGNDDTLEASPAKEAPPAATKERQPTDKDLERLDEMLSDATFTKLLELRAKRMGDGAVVMGGDNPNRASDPTGAGVAYRDRSVREATVVP